MRLAILGGGGFRVPLIVRAAAARWSAGRGPQIDEIVCYDVDPARSAAIAAVLADVSRPRLRWTNSVDDALTGADAVFSAIRVGGAAGRARDERRALDLGLLGQETVGAGGLTYGLRTLPVVLDLARRQAELAPSSWLINFTNPAGMVTQALAPVLGSRVIGICDSPTGLIRRVCRTLGARDAVPDYAGINHLGWLRSLTVDGRDLLPKLLSDDTMIDSFEEGRLFGPAVLRALGALPNEYLAFYYFAQEFTDRLRIEPTRGEIVADQQQAFYEQVNTASAAARWVATRAQREATYLAETRPTTQARDESDTEGGGYEQVALDVLDAVAGGPAVELIVNARNGSALPQLPAEMVVETRCRVDAGGAHALPASDFDLHQLGLVAGVRASEQAVIDAVTSASREAAVAGFALHPLIGSWPLADKLVGSLLADHPDLAARLRSPS